MPRLPSSFVLLALTACGPATERSHALTGVSDLALTLNHADSLAVVADNDGPDGSSTVTLTLDDGADPALLDQVSVDVAGAGGSYSLLLDAPEEREGLRIDVTISLPRGASVTSAETATALEVARFGGELTELVLSFQRGSVEFDDLRVDERADIGLVPGSASGRVEVAPGAKFGLSTANGTLDLALLVGAGGDANFGSTVGDITIDAELAEPSVLEVRARGGRIDLALPTPTGADLTATGATVTIDAAHSFEGTEFTDVKLGTLDGGGDRTLELAGTAGVTIR